MVEFIMIGDVGDIAQGAGIDDAKAAKAEREKTLALLGIAPLSPYGSEAMTTLDPEPEPKVMTIEQAQTCTSTELAGKRKPMSKAEASSCRWAHTPTPRKDAAAAGETHYISDNPCPANHVSRRYTSTGQCVACEAVRGEALAKGRLVANRS